jgi:tetratricopeptide (TPR) repeat protein
VIPAEAEPGLDRMSEDDRELLYRQSFEDPHLAIARLKAILDKFPDSRALRNWLIVAYTSAGDGASAERETRDLYARHPDYLFAKLGVAELCLKQGNLDEFEAIFDKKFDLKLMYPERNVFHVSEHVAFAMIMMMYYLRIKQDRAAQLYYNMMEEIAPNHPLTKQARNMMLKPLLRRSIERLARGVLEKGLVR